MTKLTIPTLMDLERKHGFGIKTAAKVLDLLLQLLAIANREAALADELAEALERIKGHTCADVAPGTPPPDLLWINFIATRALSKHKEARNG